MIMHLLTCAALFAMSTSVIVLWPLNISIMVCDFHQLTASRPARLKQAPEGNKQAQASAWSRDTD